MISIIVSTRKDELSLKTFSDNIGETIGVEYELVIIENHAKYSLCEAYNIGIEKAKYNFLCFAHDDILFKTTNWGNRLISSMETDNSIGLIGVAGTKFKSTYPSGWGQSPYLSQFNKGHIFSKLETQPEKHYEFDRKELKRDIEDVVCVDGVFLFTKKEITSTCRFDDKMLTNFHGYDIDFSLQVHFAKYRVIVDRKILITHHSGGNYSTEYTQANRLICKKWKSKLPAITNDTKLSYWKKNYLDYLNWYHFLTTALKRKIIKLTK